LCLEGELAARINTSRVLNRSHVWSPRLFVHASVGQDSQLPECKVVVEVSAVDSLGRIGLEFQPEG